MTYQCVENSEIFLGFLEAGAAVGVPDYLSSDSEGAAAKTHTWIGWFVMDRDSKMCLDHVLCVCDCV